MSDSTKVSPTSNHLNDSTMSNAAYDKKHRRTTSARVAVRSVAVSKYDKSIAAETQSAPGDLADLHDRRFSTFRAFGDSVVRLERDIVRDELQMLELDAETTEIECGIMRYRPRFLQRFATRNWMLFWMCWFCAVQGLLVNGLVPSAISTIERRFQLSTSTIGRIMQFYDFGYVLLCIPVSYFGGRHSKPFVLGLGLLLMGIGSFMFTLPHNISDAYTSKYSADDSGHGQCYTEGMKTPFWNGSAGFAALKECPAPENQPGTFRYVFLFSLAHFLHGVGATPLFTIGVSYIDENVGSALSSLFLGVFYAFAIFGPAIGFLMSGTFLRYHTDFLQAELPDFILHIDESDPKWVGAWWLPFQIASILAIIGVFPILSLPKVLPEALSAHRLRLTACIQHGTAVVTKHLQATRLASVTTDSAHVGAAKNVDLLLMDKHTNGRDTIDTNVVDIINISGDNTSPLKRPPIWYQFWLDIRHIPLAIYRILSNGPYMMITMGMAVDGLILSGASTFMSKYLERQFNVAPSRANMLIGCIMVPMAGIGTMFSGFIVQHFQMTCQKTLKFCIAMVTISLLLSPMYLIYCDHDKLVGVETYYPFDEHMTGGATMSFNASESSLHSHCNAHCDCLVSEFHPVCAEFNGQQMPFYSPCFAGCTDRYEPTKKEFHNCSCIPALRSSSSMQHRTVKNGYCESKCSGLLGFLIIFAPFVFCTFAVGVPLISVVLRTVNYAERSFALGIQWILVRVIGTIPAPVLFGWMFDVSCIKRHLNECTGEHGACYLYYNKLLADLFLAFCVVGQMITLLFLMLTLIFFAESMAKRDLDAITRTNADDKMTVMPSRPSTDHLVDISTR